MRRRTLITGAAAGGIGGITLIGTGAFDTASAERAATVNFADDEDAYLGLVSKSAYATTDGDGELALAFGDVSGAGDGIGRNSQFFFDEVFAIANQGTETVSITATSDTDAFDGEFRLYPTGDRDGVLDDPDNAVALETGEEQSVGTYVETGDVDVTENLDIDITIEAAFEDGNDEPDDPQPEPPETIDVTEFFSTSSLIDADGDVLDDDSVVAVRAEPTAQNENPEGDDEFVSYPDDVEIPLAAVDGTVVGFGSGSVRTPATSTKTGRSSRTRGRPRSTGPGRCCTTRRTGRTGRSRATSPISNPWRKAEDSTSRRSRATSPGRSATPTR
ncbi:MULTISPECIES: DUF1102 domain-containing protein [unclassified Halorubrum]|uniref:DUF1102 domain-containing protein n=1 Tax=unclassified Halorubrum TaxID=2642239 RepID=UPI001F53FED7|nr:MULTISPECIES: DUF1102 domain-containing protein [unclassified Halorubrum]